MVSAYKESVDTFEAKFQELLDNYQQLKSENAVLKADLEQCRSQLLKAQSSASEMRSDYEILKIARAFGQSENDKKDAYRRISRMMRDIDTCLALLNE